MTSEARLIVVSGLPGSGKTTLDRRLEVEMPAIRLPTSTGVSIRAPAQNATTGPTITFTAGARAAAGNLTALRVYVDNVAQLTINNPAKSKSFQFTQSAPVAAGKHTLVIVGYESTGAALTSTETFTIFGTTACTASAQGSSVNICSPTLASTGSPFTVAAASHTYQGTLAAMRVYLDNLAVAFMTNPKQTAAFNVTASVSAAAGEHNLVVVAYPTAGAAFTARETVTVK